MPRVLPWLKKDDQALTTGPSTPKRLKAQPAYRAFRKNGGPPSSQSPPSSPIVDSFSQVEEMQPGDDDWIMVEDEFYATAQTFTRRLHNDELKRLQQLAKVRADRYETTRPTAGKVEARVKERRDKRSRLTNSVEQTHRDEDDLPEAPELLEEQDLAIDDRDLAQLLFDEDPVTELSRRQLSGLGVSKPKTRAAAGLGRQRDGTLSSSQAQPTDGPSSPLFPSSPPRPADVVADDDSEEDSDDLDAIIEARPKVMRAVEASKSTRSDVNAGQHRNKKPSTPHTHDVSKTPASPPPCHSEKLTAKRRVQVAAFSSDSDGSELERDLSRRQRSKADERRRGPLAVNPEPPPSRPTLYDIPMF